MALLPSRSYKDLNFSFKIHPLRKDLVVLKDDNAIKRAILNLFSYRKGEKFFDADFGSGVPDLLFEPFDFVTAGSIKSEIESLLEENEPRVSLIEIAIDLDENNYEYEISIEYLIPETNQVNNVTLSLPSSSRI
mgnify:CR=1 FL=1|tara:strand:- start:1387 stop:1788 length:402 start_codon:yes stop_codon:yes gene_type:complete